ncbi:unnamed protein product [Dracunculus medinensis]|uniref:Uncharacterized protein n=1 Tax=Dracunculus medinensis TaxID=318479 RepID=A0A3P7T7H0_DRAME|nr:unnamed protein product [Dracunculus medinensis]
MLYLYRKSPQQSKNGPIFLMIGGETPVERTWLTNEELPYIKLAEKVNASIYLLEHRFYGRSRPIEDLSIINLKYLNAKQAIHDIESFVEQINRREKLNDPKWIAFGGSYSGYDRPFFCE